MVTAKPLYHSFIHQAFQNESAMPTKVTMNTTSPEFSSVIAAFSSCGPSGNNATKQMGMRSRIQRDLSDIFGGKLEFCRH